MPQWRRTIARSGTTAKRVTLTNFEKTKSLLAPPPASTKRSTRAKNNELAKHGTPKRTWPIVVIDESHRIRNPNSQQGLVCRQMAAAADFTIYMSATAGQAPHELSYLGRLLAEAAGGVAGDLDGFRALMKRLRIGRAKGRWKNWSWEPNPEDRRVMADLLYKGVQGDRAAPPAGGHRRLARGAARAGADRAGRSGPAALRGDLARVPARARPGRRQHPARHRLGRRSALPPEGQPAAHRRHRRFLRGPAGERAAGGGLGRLPGDQRHAGGDAARPRLVGRRDQRHAVRRRQRGRSASPSRPAGWTPCCSR